MTIAHQIVLAYLREHDKEPKQQMSAIGGDEIKVVYKSGQVKTYSCNLYGCILEMDPGGNHRMIAQAAGVTGLTLYGQDVPSAWVDV